MDNENLYDQVHCPFRPRFLSFPVHSFLFWATSCHLHQVYPYLKARGVRFLSALNILFTDLCRFLHHCIQVLTFQAELP